jgi:hypothetical protein
MQLRHFLAATTMLVCAGLVPSARADTVLYSSAGFIQGSQSFVQSFDITTPGTLTISLANVPWLDTIADLNCFLTTASGALGGWQNNGNESMRVAPGMIYAHWFGDANGRYQVGAYTLKVMFQPGAAPVPLPSSLVLLLSVLGLAVAWRWRRLAASAVAPAWARRTQMQLRYYLSATVAMVCVSFVSVGSTRADMTTYGSAGIATAAVIERSYVDITPRVSVGPGTVGPSATDSDRAAAGVGNPALLPGLLLFAATSFAYLWHWRSMPRTGQKSSAGTLA